MCELLGASCFGRDLPVIPRFHSPTFYIFTVLSIFLNNTFLQMTLESVNYAIFNKYQPTF